MQLLNQKENSPKSNFSLILANTINQILEKAAEDAYNKFLDETFINNNEATPILETSVNTDNSQPIGGTNV